MYKLDFSDEFMAKFVSLKAQDNYPSILNKISILSENPNNIAVPTGIPLFCEFYVNAGNKHALLFDTDIIKKTIFLRLIIRKEKLYKILNGVIEPTA